MNLAGFRIGHATDGQAHTGCTVVLCPPGAVGGVDIHGPAPGSRETALLAPDKAVTTINAVLLTGGSALGLGAADGVARYLAERNIGHPTPIRPIPIVAAAVVYDLFLGGGKVIPGPEMGYQACLVAAESTPEQGNVGVGAGVTVGKWGGFAGMMKGGFGFSTMEDGDLLVGAAVVVNSVGDVMNDDGTVLAGSRAAGGTWRQSLDPLQHFPERPPANLGTNTTLAVVFTNATLDKIGTNRLAQRANDGLAMAVRPIHTTHDGDAAFALSSNQVRAPFDVVANAAVLAVVEAIRNAVRKAVTAAGVPGLAG